MNSMKKDNSKKPTIHVYQQDIVPNAIVQSHLNPYSPSKGDLYYGKDGVRFERLGAGSTGQVLQISNGVPTWGSVINTGAAASRPSSGTFIGQAYFSTDTFALSIWTGSAWKSVTLS